jgi:hypothetical protein
MPRLLPFTSCRLSKISNDVARCLNTTTKPVMSHVYNVQQAATGTRHVISFSQREHSMMTSQDVLRSLAALPDSYPPPPPNCRRTHRSDTERPLSNRRDDKKNNHDSLRRSSRSLCRKKLFNKHITNRHGRPSAFNIRLSSSTFHVPRFYAAATGVRMKTYIRARAIFGGQPAWSTFTKEKPAAIGDRKVILIG